jgi:peptidoglycan/LPS O-acetylase OafA/YrhL
MRKAHVYLTEFPVGCHASRLYARSMRAHTKFSLVAFLLPLTLLTGIAAHLYRNGKPQLVIAMQTEQRGGPLEVYLNWDYANPHRFNITTSAMTRYVIEDFPLPLVSVRIDPDKVHAGQAITFAAVDLIDGRGSTIDLLSAPSTRVGLSGASSRALRGGGTESRLILDTTLLAAHVVPQSALFRYGINGLAWVTFLLWMVALLRGAARLPRSAGTVVATHRRNSFDLLRLLAAAMVLVHHLRIDKPTFGIGETFAPMAKSLQLGPLGVYVFFAISGYLICGSLMRDSSIPAFGLKRAARLLPGLAAFLLFCIAAGALLVSTPLIEYLFSERMLGFISNVLIFSNTAIPSLQLCQAPAPCSWTAPLWSLGYEVIMYAVLALVVVLCRSNRAAVTLATFGVLAAAIAALTHLSTYGDARLYYAAGESQLVDLSGILLATHAGLFFFGAFLRLAPYDLTARLWIVPAAIALILAASYTDAMLFSVGLILGVPLLVIALGRRASALSALLTDRVGDISYGVYIYHFAIQVIVWVYLLDTIGTVAAVVLSTAAAITLAWLSFRFVEAPSGNPLTLQRLVRNY